MTTRGSLGSWARVGMVLGFVWGAACGGQNPVAPATPVPPPPTTLPPTTLADLSASVTSPENGHTFGCRDDAHFQITVTNRGATSVAVTGITKHTAVMRGNCNSGPDFTYQVGAVALPNRTTTIVDRPVYSNGTGCCTGGPTCSGMCTFKQTFAVVTTLGDVPAGSFQYQVIFGDCGQCSASASSREACPSAK